MRSIFRLLLANLRRKKGAFTGIVLLMTIVTLSYAITVSNNRNLNQTVDESFAAQEIGDWIIWINADETPAETVQVLRSHPEITGMHEERFLCPDVPVLCDGASHTGLETLHCVRGNEQIFNEKKNGFQQHEPLQPGEIYLSYKLSHKSGIPIGSRIQIQTQDGDMSFTVRGYYQEVAESTEGIGLLCESDFNRLYHSRSDLFSINRLLYGGIELHISVQPGTDLHALQKTLNSECHLFDDAVSVVTKEEMRYAVTVIASTGTRIVAVYTVMLIAIVLIVIGNSIGTAVETEYRNLGILKAVGISRNQLRTVWSLQYALAVLLGTVLGLLLTVPAMSYLGLLFTKLSNILTSNRLALGKCVLAALVILVVCVVYVVFATAKVGRISPVRAISGGHDAVYFDSPLQVRIRKRGLNFLLALRQLTSRCKSWLGSMLIVSLMVFFLCTVMIFTGGINADLFTTPTGDIEMNMLSGMLTAEEEAKLRTVCAGYDPDAEILLWTGRMMYADDEKILLEVYNAECLFTEPLEGRLPKYDNEILVTELFAQKIHKQTGDTVTVRNGRSSADFIITGLTQNVIHPAGVLEITAAGGKRIGVETPDIGYVQMRDTAQKTALTAALNESFPDVLSAKEYEPGAELKELIETVDLVMNLVIWVMYSVSMVFAAIVVTMLCRRTFLKERTDLGIFRALGFSVPLLRRQFALRFLMIAAAGSVLGCVCSVLFSGRLLSVLMRIIGITRFAANFRWTVFVLPAAAVSMAFFVFAFLAARSVRTVSVRELVTE